MATHRIPILGMGTVPDTSGDVYIDTLDALATNDIWDRQVIIFTDTATRIGLHGGFVVPKNYVGTPKFIIVWSSDTITATNVEWDLDYRAVGGNDTESLDQTGNQQSLNVADAAPSAAWERLEAEVAATAGNFAVDDEVEFTVFRDGTDAGDTMVGNAVLFSLLFEYADA